MVQDEKKSLEPSPTAVLPHVIWWSAASGVRSHYRRMVAVSATPAAAPADWRRCAPARPLGPWTLPAARCAPARLTQRETTARKPIKILRIETLGRHAVLSLARGRYRVTGDYLISIIKGVSLKRVTTSPNHPSSEAMGSRHKAVTKRHKESQSVTTCVECIANESQGSPKV